MGNNLQSLRKAAKLSQDALARMMGTTRSQLVKLERGERRLSDVWISRAASALNVDPGALVTDTGTTSIPVMGYVGAGAEIMPEFEQVPPDGLFTVELPFSVPPGIIGFEIRGDSMLPRYDEGDVILVYEDQQHAPEYFIGEEAAIRTTDDRRFLKRLMRGALRGRFNLESWNAKTIEDVGIHWVGEIYLTVRSGQLRRIRQKGSLKVVPD